MSTPFRLLVPFSIQAEMFIQAQKELPNECCGLLAGRFENDAMGVVGRVARRYPLINAEASPNRFTSEPGSMFGAEKARRLEGLEFLAVYHSHPRTPAIPSTTDLECNYSPEVVNLIISLQKEMPEIRGWWLERDGYKEASVEWVK